MKETISWEAPKMIITFVDNTFSGTGSGDTENGGSWYNPLS